MLQWWTCPTSGGHEAQCPASVSLAFAAVTRRPTVPFSQVAHLLFKASSVLILDLSLLPARMTVFSLRTDAR